MDNNIQRLIDSAKQSLNSPESYKYIDESFESCIKCTACTFNTAFKTFINIFIAFRRIKGLF